MKMGQNWAAHAGENDTLWCFAHRRRERSAGVRACKKKQGIGSVKARDKKTYRSIGLARAGQGEKD